MRNPLHRRFLRQLLHNPGRYLGVFALPLVTVSVASGFLAMLSSVRVILGEVDVANVVENARRNLGAHQRRVPQGGRGGRRERLRQLEPRCQRDG